MVKFALDRYCLCLYKVGICVVAIKVFTFQSFMLELLENINENG